MGWGVQTNSRTSTSTLNGAVQTTALPGSRWVLSLNFPAQRGAERAALIGHLMQAAGTGDLLSVPNFARRTPRGSILLSGVTASAAAQFATSLTLNNCGASRTLLRGDLISVAGQVLMITADATANGSGVMAVSVRHMLRAAVVSGAAVATSSPVVTCRLADPNLSSNCNPADLASPMTVDLVEVFA